MQNPANILTQLWQRLRPSSPSHYQPTREYVVQGGVPYPHTHLPDVTVRAGAGYANWAMLEGQGFVRDTGEVWIVELGAMPVPPLIRDDYGWGLAFLTSGETDTLRNPDSAGLKVRAASRWWWMPIILELGRAGQRVSPRMGYCVTPGTDEADSVASPLRYWGRQPQAGDVVIYHSLIS